MSPTPAQITRRALLGAGTAIVAATVVPAPLARATTGSTGPRVRFGSWTAGMDADATLLDATATKVGAAVSIASVFRGRGDTPWWPYNVDYRLGVNAGRDLLVSWSLQDWGNFSWWASGNGDSVLRAQAQRLAAYGGPVVLRPWAEMNGDWVNFQPRPKGRRQTSRGGTPQQFIAAWRRVVNVVRSAGASNVRFCFNPTTDTYVGTTDVRTIFPGTAWVDVLGLDGYNWGTAGQLTWRSFVDIYTTQYQRLVGLHPNAPVWICEVSSADPLSAGFGPVVTAPAGESKGLWWQAMMSQLATGFPAVQAVSFFDADKERDWRVDSSNEALSGLQKAISSLG